MRKVRYRFLAAAGVVPLSLAAVLAVPAVASASTAHSAQQSDEAGDSCLGQTVDGLLGNPVGTVAATLANPLAAVSGATSCLQSVLEGSI